MKIVRLCSLFMAAAFFGGYASAAPAPLSPEVLDLEPVKIQSTTILPIQIVEVYKATSWALADLEQTLLAGRYTSSKENSLGTFYLAENYSFANKYRRNQYHLLRGGFWLPKSGEFKPRLYVLAGGRPMIVESIAGLSPAAIEATAAGPSPITVGVSSAVGMAGVSIAGGIVSAIVEAEYAKPPREEMAGPVTSPAILKALAEAVAQLKPVVETPAVPDHARLAASGWSSTDDARPTPDFLSSCAAAMAQKIFLIKPAERENSPELYAGVGRYMWLSCVSSSPSYARAQYALQREKHNAKAESDLKTCAGDLNCMTNIHNEIDGQLMRCLSYQRQNARIIAGLAPDSIPLCSNEKLQ